ncbi:hypothetical protein A9Q94_19285 [Rhodobacterales bacterium 56_14_T64]|nr:hypothetical protein A9Q94_19285 [Rhodobacterales bacterium 56_14_T64]
MKPRQLLIAVALCVFGLAVLTTTVIAGATYASTGKVDQWLLTVAVYSTVIMPLLAAVSFWLIWCVVMPVNFWLLWKYACLIEAITGIPVGTRFGHELATDNWLKYAGPSGFTGFLKRQIQASYPEIGEKKLNEACDMSNRGQGRSGGASDAPAHAKPLPQAIRMRDI